MRFRHATMFAGWFAMLVAALCVSPRDALGDGNADEFQKIPWTTGPAMGDMGPHAQVQVPNGFLFTGPDGTQRFLELTENPPNPKTVGVLLPVGDDSEDFIVFFDYDDSGHVKDDDRSAIDANVLLTDLKAANEAGNAERRRRGWEGLHVEDWVVPPGYEPSTKRLAWGLGLRTDTGGKVANYDVRVLGRTGVMSVTLACSPELVQPLIPRLQELLGGFEFKSGHRYAEWRSGDKLASYGLTGLIAGGTVVAAAKAGWLAKLAAVFAKGAKVIVVAILAVLGGVWRMLFGGKAKTSSSQTR